MYVGRHVPYKNLKRLISAFQPVAEKTNAELWIAGPEDARYTPQYRQQAKELGLAARIRFIGYVGDSQLPILMNQAIALVMATLWEGFGLPALEAMACGTPVIASKTGSLPELTGDAALMVDPYRVDEISAALQAVVSDPMLWQ
nr:glycosyltransferase [Romeria gracilis]